MASPSLFARRAAARLRTSYPAFMAWFGLRWLLLAGLIGALAGTASAGFLVALAWATAWRAAHPWALALLPAGGLLVGLAYHRFGNRVVRGNNLIVDEIHDPGEQIPLRLVPLVLGGTLLTHLFGGSAGREGTAVQMGGALADQLARWLPRRERPLLLVAGMSAGFASVFGTPLAGAVFGLEVLWVGAVRYEAILPSFLAAVVADAVTRAWGVGHSAYPALASLPLTAASLGCTLLAGVLFGLAARSFATLTHWVSRQFARLAWAPLRPLAGGVLVAGTMWALGTSRYEGLGLPVIAESFQHPLAFSDFAWKLALTALTLGAGFKGGEVTPLFFMGAALGSALAGVLPLPVALLAALGFVGVFAGAANTPLACLLLGLELFGTGAGIYLGLSCVLAYLFSGHGGIYPAQRVGHPKHPLLGRHRAVQRVQRRGALLAVPSLLLPPSSPMPKSSLLAAALLGWPLLASAQTAPAAPRFYVGLGATVLTARPFHAYSNALAGPGLTVGWQFTPRLALQLGGAYQWGKQEYANSYDDSILGPTVNSSSTASQAFTLPLLLRATLTNPASPWRLDALGGARAQFTSSTYTFTRVSPGRSEGEQYHYSGATASLLLGPGVRYAVRPRLEVALSALATLNLHQGYSDFSNRLSSQVTLGANFYFGQ